MRKKVLFGLLIVAAAFCLLAATAAADVRRFTEWSPPVLLGPEVNSSALDTCVSVSKDGLTLFFSSARPGGLGKKDWYVSQRASVGDSWGPAQWLGPTVNSANEEHCLCLGLDEHEIIMRSDRPGGLGAHDLYILRRADRRDPFGWGAPQNLGSNINTAGNEYAPVLFEDESGREVLYFCNSSSGKGVVYASVRGEDGSFGPAEVILTPSNAQGLAIRRDGLELIVSSSDPGSMPAPDGKGLSYDLWAYTRDSTRDPWSAPVLLSRLSSPYSDFGRMSLSPDGLTLYFTSDRPGGFGDRDLYMATRSILK